MKFFVISCLVASATIIQGATSFGKNMEMANDCKTQTGASPGDMKNLADNVLPTTRTGACLIACICKSSGLMLSNNSIDLTKITPADADSIVIRALKSNCVTPENIIPDPCDTLQKIFSCYSKSNGQ